MDGKKKAIKKAPAARCEDCEHYDMDENGDYYCKIDLDEDEEISFRLSGVRACPYFKFYDEYKSVQKQN